jgi:predicted HicB family RNase H-like nuclease
MHIEPPAEPMTDRVHLVLSPSLKRAIETAAYSVNMSVNAWLRAQAMRALEAQQAARLDAAQ